MIGKRINTFTCLTCLTCLAAFVTMASAARAQGTALDICNDAVGELQFSIASYRGETDGWVSVGWESLASGNCITKEYMNSGGGLYRGEIYLYADMYGMEMTTGKRQFCVPADNTLSGLEIKNDPAVKCEATNKLVRMKSIIARPGVDNRLVVSDEDFFPVVEPNRNRARLLTVDLSPERVPVLVVEEGDSWRGFKINGELEDIAGFVGAEDLSTVHTVGATDPLVAPSNAELNYNNNPEFTIGDSSDVGLYVVRKELASEYFLWFRGDKATNVVFQPRCVGLIKMLGLDPHDAKMNDPRTMPFIDKVVPIDCVVGSQPVTFDDWCSQRDLLTPDVNKTIDLMIEEAKRELNRTGDISCREASLTLANEFDNLSLVNKGLTDIRPVASLVNLKGLNLSQNSILDVEPIGNLVGLTRLFLLDNQIQDVSPLSSLVNLIYINLKNNQIDDVSSLVTLKKLTSKRLILQGNNISAADCPFEDKSICLVD